MDGLLDSAGVFEDHLPWCVGVALRQPELAGSVGNAGQAAALYDAPEVLRPQSGIGHCRCNDPDHWAGSGRAEVCEDLRRNGCDRHGDDDGHCAFSKPGRTDTAQMGEGVGHRVMWEFAAVESGVGLGTWQRQEPGQGVDDQGQCRHLAGEVVCGCGLRCRMGA